MAFRSLVLFVLALAVAGSALYLWRRPRPNSAANDREPAMVPSPPEPPAPASSPVPARAPAPDEIQPALDRVFDRTLVADWSLRPAFAAGDLNGDDITDLAVAVRPRGEDAIAPLNAGLMQWRRIDAQDPAPPPGAPARPAPVEIARGDLLLAVIHGVEAGAWRDPGATQGYLVKNALGSGLRLRPLMEVPDEVRVRVIRSHKGDVIAQERAGRKGVVFWTGAAYAWGDQTPARASSSR